MTDFPPSNIYIKKKKKKILFVLQFLKGLKRFIMEPDAISYGPILAYYNTYAPSIFLVWPTSFAKFKPTIKTFALLIQKNMHLFHFSLSKELASLVLFSLFNHNILLRIIFRDNFRAHCVAIMGFLLSTTPQSYQIQIYGLKI